MSVLDEIYRTRGPVPCPECNDPMIETARAGTYECSCGGESELDATFHAEVDRWWFRSDDSSTTVLEAWSDGVQLDAYAQDEHQLRADEIRYNHETTTVILRKDIGIVTVIDYRTARDGIQRSVIKALLEDNARSVTIAEALNIAEIGEDEFREITNETSDDIRATRGATLHGGKRTGCIARK